MTGSVAGAVAVAAVLLALVLIAVVLRLRRDLSVTTERLDNTQTELVQLRGRVAEQDAGLERLIADQQAAPATRDMHNSRDTHNTREGGADDTHPVPLITGIGEPSGEDELTTARIASVTLGGPLIKVAAFSHGVRRALDEEQRMRISYAVRKELRRQRKLRRRRRADQAPSKGWST